jgi:hypothetical protein
LMTFRIVTNLTDIVSRTTTAFSKLIRREYLDRLISKT